jgi:hypothetical protein
MRVLMPKPTAGAPAPAAGATRRSVPLAITEEVAPCCVS